MAVEEPQGCHHRRGVHVARVGVAGVRGGVEAGPGWRHTITVPVVLAALLAYLWWDYGKTGGRPLAAVIGEQKERNRAYNAVASTTTTPVCGVLSAPPTAGRWWSTIPARSNRSLSARRCKQVTPAGRHRRVGPLEAGARRRASKRMGPVQGDGRLVRATCPQGRRRPVRCRRVRPSGVHPVARPRRKARTHRGRPAVESRCFCVSLSPRWRTATTSIWFCVTEDDRVSRLV